MTIAGDLNALMSSHGVGEDTRKLLIESIFDWLLCGDVLSHVGKVCNIEDYIVAISELKETQT